MMVAFNAQKKKKTQNFGFTAFTKFESFDLL